MNFQPNKVPQHITGIPFDFFINDQPSLSWAGEVSQFGLAMAKNAETRLRYMNDHAQEMGHVLSELLRGHVTESTRQEFCQSATHMVKPLYQRIKELENKNEELKKKIDGKTYGPYNQTECSV